MSSGLPSDELKDVTFSLVSAHVVSASYQKQYTI